MSEISNAYLDFFCSEPFVHGEPEVGEDVREGQSLQFGVQPVVVEEDLPVEI